MKRIKNSFIAMFSLIFVICNFAACRQKKLPTSGSYDIIDYFVASFDYDKNTEKYSLIPITIAPKPISEEKITFNEKKFTVTTADRVQEFEHREPTNDEKENQFFKYAASAQVFEVFEKDNKIVCFIWTDKVQDEETKKKFHCTKIAVPGGNNYFIRIYAI